MDILTSILENKKEGTDPAYLIFSGTKGKWWILLGLTICAALDILIATSSTVAIGEITGHLNASKDEMAWLSVGYFSSKLVFLILSIQLSKVLGGKPLLQYSLLLFILGAFLCGTTSSYVVFLLGRLLLGAGSAAFYTVAQAVLFEIFPLKKQGLIQALFSLAIVLGPNVIPAIGGWLTYHFIWQLPFLGSVIIGLLMVPLISLLSDSVLPKVAKAKIGWLSVLWLLIGLCTFQFVMEEGARYDWFEEKKIVLFSIISVIGICLFLFQNKRDGESYRLIDFSVFKNASFSLAFLISFVSGFALFGSGSIIPGFVKNVLRYHSADVGTIFLPSGIAVIVGLIISAVVVDTKKIAPFVSAAFGALCVIVSMVLISDVTVASGFPDMVPPTMVRGLGLGLLFVPIIYIAFNELKGIRLLTGTGLFNFGRQCGGSLAIAFLPTYLTHQTAYHRKNLLDNLHPYSNLFDERVQGATQALISRGYNPIEAEGAALGTVNIALNVQSAVLAFQNTFFVISIVFLCAAPVIISFKVFLAKKQAIHIK